MMMATENIMERIEQLKQTIKAARKAYEAGQPIMSDKEYDAIEMELRMLAPRCRLLKKVGGKRGNVELLNPMLSLTKAQSLEELPAWTRKAVCTLKIDGIALRLVIRNGQIVLACMRGNGFVGTDCTAQAQRLGLVIDADFSGDVRGELYQDVETWKGWTNRPQTSRNNAVRAMMGNPSEVPFYGLHFAAYDMIGSGCDTFTSKLAKLARAGFETAPIVSDTVRPFETIDQTDIVEVAGNLYPADGIVFRMDSEKAFERAGHDEFSPNGAIAIKWHALPAVVNNGMVSSPRHCYKSVLPAVAEYTEEVASPRRFYKSVVVKLFVNKLLTTKSKRRISSTSTDAMDRRPPIQPTEKRNDVRIQTQKLHLQNAEPQSCTAIRQSC